MDGQAQHVPRECVRLDQGRPQLENRYLGTQQGHARLLRRRSVRHVVPGTQDNLPESWAVTGRASARRSTLR